MRGWGFAGAERQVQSGRLVEKALEFLGGVAFRRDGVGCDCDLPVLHPGAVELRFFVGTRCGFYDRHEGAPFLIAIEAL
jgi:hypothetical protein